MLCLVCVVFIGGELRYRVDFIVSVFGCWLVWMCMLLVKVF